MTGTPHERGRGHVHMGEEDWARLADQAELEGELFLAFVTDAAVWVTELRGGDAPPVRRIVDIGSGPGVGTCELARVFPEADVVAVDGSPAMLERAQRRADAQGLDARVSTHHAELPEGLDGIGPADLIWASMSLHHVGDEVAALRLLRDILGRDGVIAIAEKAEPSRFLPDDLDIGPPGLADRIEDAHEQWFAAMRDGLAHSVPSADLPSMFAMAGFDVIGSRVARLRFNPPAPDLARRLALGRLRRSREDLGEVLGPADLRTLDILVDVDDARSVMRRDDVVVASSRQIVIARPTEA